MNALAKPAPAKKPGDYPHDVLSDAHDLLHIVRLALGSEWAGADDHICFASVMGIALNKIERVRAVIDEGVLSQYDPACPKGKMVIPEFVPGVSS
jgi:hypothetical protein